MKKTMIMLMALFMLVGTSFSDQKPGKVVVNPKLLQPTIIEVDQKPGHGIHHDFVMVKGSFFGNTIGLREVRLGHSVLDTNQWAMQYIVTVVPWNTGIQWGKKYPVRIWDKATNKAISNEILLLLKIFPLYPDQANAQSQITLDAANQDIGNSQGTRRVIFGSTAAQVVSWGIHSISVIVPNLYPGKYDCYIEDNGEIVSYKFPVKILPPLVK